ncbi:MAG: hypothetical protein ABI742_11310 [Gemmatimonadota bacterium]
MPPSALAIVASVLVGLACFAGLWLLITGALASFSGWTALAEAYPGGLRPNGEVVRRQVVGLGRTKENGVTNVILAPQGLYLFPMVLFGYRRAPVLVPWGRLRYVESHQIFWSRWHEVDLGGITILKVRGQLLSALREHGVSIPADALA